MITKDTYPIKDLYGRNLGYIEEDNEGNRQIKDFYGRIKGFYDKKTNTTKDFYGRMVGQGDMLTMLLNK